MKAILQNPETTLLGKIGNIILGLLIIIGWVSIISHVLPLITGIPQSPGEISFSWAYIFFACIMAPLTEEVVFRLFPLTLVKHSHPNIIIATTLASSILFGYAHKNGYYSILYQGVMGFVFACVYIKNGFSYWSSVVLHGLWNLTCLLHPM
jgi:membrane protease YdiL (CAAX protease family)